ncbi:MAG: hypothetical protein ACTSW1_07635 [Candidatus Hodarchaeales archaeon]
MNCKECICKPVCRHKSIARLLHSCSIVWDHLYVRRNIKPIQFPRDDSIGYNYDSKRGFYKRRIDFVNRVQTLYSELDPSCWSWVQDNPKDIFRIKDRDRDIEVLIS